MISRFLRKYLSIVFVLATLMGTMHHHNDLKQHSDCQICTIQSSIAHADTPVDVVYLTQLDIYRESIVTQLTTLHDKQSENPLHARAPPFFS
ncbi:MULTISPECIES: hypothetical protein [Sulfurimonas]|uniref:hypothetical protein n=1 Tax=Sulfurimonas TaxID=202746 RepID=UPI00126495A7|nr:hypothetical protein [Sulfurimonas indica]